MSDDQITLEIDGQEVQARPGQMLIEVTDAMDNYVPRFCYHKKLTVAANCRMCLVEVEKAPKPLPACATPVMAGMKVKTQSPLAVEAQKSVMEFLLINHPLDCPICDQGGECELQDLAMGYGSGVSRYQENKRVVQDKNIGPLVQTEMTRCIHCTRCVRFGEEIAGLRELGVTGRGEFMEIGTYIEKSMVSELSGNVIDLCPVGALTSKPFRFSARAWEMSQYQGIAMHDALGSNLHFHVKDDTVKRVVPAENDAINEVWLSDRDRFSYEGLYSDSRLTMPMIKQSGEWQEVEWETAFTTIKDKLGRVIDQHGIDKVGALVSANSSTEEMYLLQKLMRGLGTNNIDHRLRQADFSDQDKAPAWPSLGQDIADLENLDAALVVGSYIRKDQPLLNLRLRKAVLQGAKVMTINPVQDEYNYDLHAQCTSADLVTSLAAVLKAVQEHTGRDSEARNLIAGVTVTQIHQDIAKAMVAAEQATVLLGNLVISHPQLSLLRYLAGVLAHMLKSPFGYLGEAANVAGAWQAGAIPHRLAGGGKATIAGLDAQQMLAAQLPAYVLMNLDPALDCLDGGSALSALAAAECVIAISPYKHASYMQHADVLLPQALYAENEGSSVNIMGVSQQQSQIVSAPGEARAAWRILRVLANTLAVEGFEFENIKAVADEFARHLAKKTCANDKAWRASDSLVGLHGAVQRVGYVPMNSMDALSRHAPALQQTTDVANAVAEVNTATANQFGITSADKIKLTYSDAQHELACRINDAVADHCVLLHGAHADTIGLGPLWSEVIVEPVGES